MPESQFRTPGRDLIGRLFTPLPLDTRRQPDQTQKWSEMGQMATRLASEHRLAILSAPFQSKTDKLSKEI